MGVEMGKTFRYMREKREVTEEAKSNQKNYIKIKKSILDLLKDEELNIDQLTEKLNMPKPEVVFYLMSLLKYGYIQTAAIDDMDEYFSYKLKK